MFACAGWILFSTLADLLRKTHKFTAIRSMPPAYYGMVMAHAGVAVLLMGVTAATVWKEEKILWMTAGDTVAFAGKTVTFIGIRPDVGKNFTIERAILSVQGAGDDAPAFLLPEKRWYPAQQRELSETALRADGFAIDYAVMGDQDKQNPFRRVIRLYHHPLVLWVLLGALMIATGGLMGMASPSKPASPSARKVKS
jgi:cytochrome c-type biogenesis protein CcmF